MERKKIKKAKRIVIKVGASVLTAKGLKLDERWIKNFAEQVAVLIKHGH